MLVEHPAGQYVRRDAADSADPCHTAPSPDRLSPPTCQQRALVEHPVSQRAGRDAAERACDGAHQDDEAIHLGREEVAESSIHQQEDLARRDLAEQHQPADGCQPTHVMQVGEVGVGAGGLVLLRGVVCEGRWRGREWARVV
eukprot:366094-Chlamydomonas_euryale.AAC.1